MSCRQWLSSAVRRLPSGAGQQQTRALSTSTPDAKGLQMLPRAGGGGGSGGGGTMIRRVVGIRGGNPNNNNNPTDALQSLLSLGDTRRSGRGPVTAEEQREIMEQQQQANNARLSVRDLRNSATTDNFLSYMPRRWKAGDVYSPRDLSPVEQKKWTKRQAPLKDIVDLLGFNPLDNYKNFSFISEFMTPFGRIKHSRETGLRPVNQRKVAKAIRRAIGMGLHPSVHKHPELMRLSNQGFPMYVPRTTSTAEKKL